MLPQSKYFAKTFLVLALFSITYTITSLYVLYSQNHTVLPSFLYAKDSIPEYISCSHPEKGNFLDSVGEDPKPPNSIFFHETTCVNFLRNREACSVESAARAHPDKKVYVIFASSLKEIDCRTGVIAALSNLPNVELYRMNLKTYNLNTPLQNVSLLRLMWLGKWNNRKTRELIKTLTLHKFGGIVIDLDVMVVGNLDKLGDTWASADGDGFGSSIISVQRGLSGMYYSRHFFRTLKQHIAFDLGLSLDSPLKDSLQKLCNTTNVTEMTRENCKGFQVYSSEFTSLKSPKSQKRNATASYLGYYLWDEPSANRTDILPKHSFYARLAEKYCPKVYSEFMAYDENDKNIQL
ncbi:lactosylceramide 4-alpha-galactosyltransferase-like [Leguminivora glycinivorella]|uniref:lactosylceramide 4-alpha-galactosyltransferase-like n=1 Tax=Leguminivora glycinivorella TaxID=1035111 RepID=UPI00200CE1E9|nr:lactosylceramide 4-alpha-galactosyltransferase-like [Leguminivora glycinivorella]